MIEYESIKDFVKRIYGLDLYPVQEQMIKAVLEGGQIIRPRLTGKTFANRVAKKYMEERKQYDKSS